MGWPMQQLATGMMSSRNVAEDHAQLKITLPEYGR